MRIGIVTVLVLALAGGAGAASPGANVALVFAQNLGTLEPRTTDQHANICAAPPNGVLTAPA